jgi:hypothetical protein
MVTLMLTLNAAFLAVPCATDIVSFPAVGSQQDIRTRLLAAYVTDSRHAEMPLNWHLHTTDKFFEFETSRTACITQWALWWAGHG